VKSVDRDSYGSAKMFIDKIGLHSCLEAADIAMASGVPLSRVWRYFCGVCWNKVRELEARHA
jgi:hypothetical protein